jgi:hypothetical protein
VAVILLSVTVVAAAVVAEIARKPALPLDALRMTLGLYAVVYFLIPAVLPRSYACAPYCGGVPLLPVALASVGLFAMIFGAVLATGLPVVAIRQHFEPQERSEFTLVLLGLAVSILALGLFASSYGGFANALAFGALQRYTGRELVEVSDSALALYFVNIGSVVIAIAQYKIYVAPALRRRYAAVLAAGFVVVTVYGLIHASRGALFNIALLMLVVHFNMRGFRLSTGRILVLTLVAFMGVWFAAYGKAALAAVATIVREGGDAVELIERRETGYVSGRLIAEFSHPSMSLARVTEAGISPNWMRHFVVAPVHLVPSRLLGSTGSRPYRITEENTQLLTGSPVGGVPPGLLASLWYGGGLAGLVLGCLLYGAFLGQAQRQLRQVVLAYPAVFPVALYAYYRIAWFVNNGDLSIFLKHTFHIAAFGGLIVGYVMWRRLRFRMSGGSGEAQVRGAPAGHGSHP